MLEPDVPYVWSRNWDKCERLRLALLESFIRYHWPIRVLMEAISDTVTLRGVMELALKTREGRRWLREIGGELSDVEMSNANREVVESARRSADWFFDWV
jgi:hypothetical protein